MDLDLPREDIWWIGIVWHPSQYDYDSRHYRFSCSNLTESEIALLSSFGFPWSGKAIQDDWVNCSPDDRYMLDGIWEKIEAENEYFVEIDEKEWLNTCDYFISRCEYQIK